jgi:hypothetical protein
MPVGFIHQMQDMIAFGPAYAEIHRAKDAWAQIVPGRRHREVGHEWYQKFRKDWDFSNPFPEVVNQQVRNLGRSHGPDAAERLQVDLAHDCLDRTWDDLSKECRESCEAFFVWLVYRPDLLKSWAGVDVVGGKIQRSYSGCEVWEDCPEVKEQYKRLRREVSRHHKWRLRKALARSGQ